MKALTIHQPWAWAIAHGGKDIENRTQIWHHRGPLAIHAGQQIAEHGLTDPVVRRAWAEHGTDLAMAPALKVRGAVVAVVDLTDAHVAIDRQLRWGPMTPPCCESPWAQFLGLTTKRPTHLVLANVRPLAEPVPCRGAQGLWTLPPDVEDAVLAQIAA